jgi:glycosyltransferase involved in cell wall biosynthesis
MESKLVSIITPLHNSERFIGETIESVQGQTYANWEMLIVDDCSTDRSAEIVQRFRDADCRIRLISLPSRGGPALARNSGIREARGRYIIFLDSDDIWFPHLLETEVDVMLKKDAAIVFASYERATEDKKTNLGPFIVPAKVNYRDLLKTCSISCLTGMYDAGKVGKVYMPDFHKREDYGLWLAILKQGHTAWGIAEPLALYRMRKGSVSRNKLHIAYRQWRYYRTEERLPPHECVYFFCRYAISSFKKYIV